MSTNTPQTLSASLELNPQLDQWLHIKADGRISVYSGKVELGQGINSALALIAAEELDVNVERIDIAVVDSEYSPNERNTTGSQSLETRGTAIRQAAAYSKRVRLPRST